MTRLTNFQEKVLQKAYEKHTQGRRPLPTFRVCIKAPFNQRPTEIMEDVELISGFTKGDWLHFRGMGEVMNHINTTKGFLEEYLRKHFPEKIDRGYTSNIKPEVFFHLGFVFAMSHQFYVRSKAAALMKEWQAQGLDCFIHSELPAGADLKKDDIAGNLQTIERAFEALEKKGLVIHVKGKYLFWDWEGISLTEAGLKMVEELQDKASESVQDLPGVQEEISPDTMLLKCPECAGIYYRLTEKFNPKMECIGDMFQLLPKYGPNGANWQALNLNDSGENLICPNCDGLYVNPEGFLKKGVLVKAEDYLTGN